jgi:ribonuclease HI
METLQQSGMRIKLEWTPGHVEAQGNEIADRLAKEAAKEAQERFHFCFDFFDDIEVALRLPI